MAKALARTFVEIDAEQQLLDAKISKLKTTLPASLGQIGAQASRAMGIGLTALGAGTIAATAGLAKLAAGVVETNNLFTVSMAEMASAGEDWTGRLSDSLRLNEADVKRNLGVFNVMLKSMGLGTEEAFEMSKGLTSLTFDLASFFNLNPEDAFLKLQSAISGEIEPLRRLGVVINETALQEIALRQGLEGRVAMMDEATKVQLRMQAIMEQTTAAQGDMGRTINDTTNLGRGLVAQFQEWAQELGANLLPLIDSVLMKGLALVEMLRAWTSENAGLAKRILEVGAVLGVMASVIGPILLILPQIIAGFKALAVVAGLLSSPILAVGAAVALLGIAFLGLKGAQELLEVAKAPIEEISTTATSTAEAVVGANDIVITSNGEVIQSIRDVGGFWEKSSKTLADVSDQLQTSSRASTESIEEAMLAGKKFWEEQGIDVGLWAANVETETGRASQFYLDHQQALDTLKEFGKLTFESLAGIITGFGDFLGRVAFVAWEGLKAVGVGAMDALMEVGGVLIDFLGGDWTQAWEGTKDLMVSIWGTITGAVSSAWETIGRIMEFMASKFQFVIDLANKIPGVDIGGPGPAAGIPSLSVPGAGPAAAAGAVSATAGANVEMGGVSIVLNGVSGENLEGRVKEAAKILVEVIQRGTASDGASFAIV